MGSNGKYRTRRDYYWVCAVENVSGRPIVQGPHNTEAEANQYGFAHIQDGDFKVYMFPTINKIAARDYFKNKRLEQTGQLAEVFKRAKYPK